MANQMIALQAKAPDMPSFTDYIQIREHAQNRQNAMLKQQQEQNAMLRKRAEADALNNAYGQAFDPATGRIDARKLSGSLAQGGFGSSIPGVQQDIAKMQGAQTETSAAQLKHLMEFSKASRDEFGNAASIEDALGRAQRLAQAFPDMAPHLQAGLADMPKDPAGFAAWKQDVLRKNLTAEQQLKQQFFKIEDATGQHILSVPEVGGAARVVEGSRTSSAPKTQFVWGANGGNIVDTRTGQATPVTEGGGGATNYDTVYGNGAYAKPSMPITGMTMGQLQDFQRNSLIPATRGKVGAGEEKGTGAVGAYQIVYGTLKNYAPRLFGENWQSVPFTPENQERLAEAIYNDAKNGNLKDVWSSMPNNKPGAYSNVPWQQVRGKIAQGESGGGGRLMPAPTTRPDKADATKSEAYSQSAIDAFDRAISSGEGLLKHPGFSAAVGSGIDPAAIGSYNPFTGKSFAGTEAANFETDLETMKSQVFLPMVQSMKGLGALSNAEGEKLTAAIGNLNARQSEVSFQKNMSQILSDLKKYSSRSRSGGAQPAQPAAKPAANSGWGTAKVVGGR